MTGKWWCMCLIFQCFVYAAFAQEEEWRSYRQRMLLAGISSHLRQHRARKRMGRCLPFLKDHINIITIMLLLPEDILKGDFPFFSTFWMIFYLLNITLLLCEILLFQSFPLAFTWSSSVDEPQVLVLGHRFSWLPNVCIMIGDGTWFHCGCLQQLFHLQEKNLYFYYWQQYLLKSWNLLLVKSGFC